MQAELERHRSFAQSLLLMGYPEALASAVAAKTVELVGLELASQGGEPGAAYFIERLLVLKDKLISGSVTIPEQRLLIGKEFDFLSTDCWNMGFFKALCLGANALVPTTNSVAIVATVRNEGPFILEWIAHHRAIGIADFFIYTNDNTDGSLDLLRALADAGVITLIENEVASGANPQVKAYEHALMFNGAARKFKWLMFLDADELFIPFSGTNFVIDDLLTDLAKTFEDLPASISFNWMWMGSSEHVRRAQGKRLAETFEVGGPMSSFVKSLVNPAFVLSMRSVHKPVLQSRSFGVNSAFKSITMDGHDSAFEFAGGEVRHYWNKSFEEFLVKQSRGVDRAIWGRNTELFFSWDIAPPKGGFRPLPKEISIRTERHLAQLNDISGLSEIEKKVNGAYALLALEVCPAESIEAHYLFSKNRAMINDLLESPIPRVSNILSSENLLQDVYEIAQKSGSRS